MTTLGKSRAEIAALCSTSGRHPCRSRSSATSLSIVIWTKRHADILQAVQAGGVTSVVELAARLNVSPSTIRRDLRLLDGNGELTRTYGGAVITARHDGNGKGHDEPEQPFSQVMGADSTPKENKERAAARAAELVVDGSVVLLDIGVTTTLLARHLRGRPITVITSNLGVLDE